VKNVRKPQVAGGGGWFFDSHCRLNQLNMTFENCIFHALRYRNALCLSQVVTIAVYTWRRSVLRPMESKQSCGYVQLLCCVYRRLWRSLSTLSSCHVWWVDNISTVTRAISIFHSLLSFSSSSTWDGLRSVICLLLILVVSVYRINDRFVVIQVARQAFVEVFRGESKAEFTGSKFILHTSPHHSHHLRSHHLSLPQPFTPDLKLISVTNSFLRSLSGAIYTAFADLGPDLLLGNGVCLF